MTCMYWNEKDSSCNLWDVVCFCRGGGLTKEELGEDYYDDYACYTKGDGYYNELEELE